MYISSLIGLDDSGSASKLFHPDPLEYHRLSEKSLYPDPVVTASNQRTSKRLSWKGMQRPSNETPSV